jgi:DNA-binding TFAR19-related protein (PDSD5 family)
MSLPLVELAKLRVSEETAAVLDGEAEANGQHTNELVRAILDEWAEKRVHALRLAHKRLKTRGLGGIDWEG